MDVLLWVKKITLKDFLFLFIKFIQPALIRSLKGNEFAVMGDLNKKIESLEGENSGLRIKVHVLETRIEYLNSDLLRADLFRDGELIQLIRAHEGEEAAVEFTKKCEALQRQREKNRIY